MAKDGDRRPKGNPERPQPPEPEAPDPSIAENLGDSEGSARRRF